MYCWPRALPRARQEPLGALLTRKKQFRMGEGQLNAKENPKIAL